MLSKIAQYNLERDKKVLGKKWLRTYGNYFSDEDNFQNFIKAVKPYLPPSKLDILYVASASGLLGERLVQNLGQGRLTLVDISKKHLAENKNIKTKKVCCDLLKLDLKKKYDLIIMRSSLDYFPSLTLQVKVLKIIRWHLKKDGFFINQPAYAPNIVARNILNKIYNNNKKIGNRFFQSVDLKKIYRQAGFVSFKKIGSGKDLVLTEQEHVERYGITSIEIAKIKKIIGKNIPSAKSTKSGYTLKFQFPIFLAK